MIHVYLKKNQITQIKKEKENQNLPNFTTLG